MDIYCTTCGEPWDMDALHEEISERIRQGLLAPLPSGIHEQHNTEQYMIEVLAYRAVYDFYYETVRNEFYRKGCKAMHASTGFRDPKWCVKKTTSTTAAMSVMINIMGDDLDGIASLLDDLAFMGELR